MNLQHCPTFRWHLGDAFSYAVPVPLIFRPLDPRVTAVRHLCFDAGNGRCASSKAEGPAYSSERNQFSHAV